MLQSPEAFRRYLSVHSNGNPEIRKEDLKLRYAEIMGSMDSISMEVRKAYADIFFYNDMPDLAKAIEGNVDFITVIDPLIEKHKLGNPLSEAEKAILSEYLSSPAKNPKRTSLEQRVIDVGEILQLKDKQPEGQKAKKAWAAIKAKLNESKIGYFGNIDHRGCPYLIFGGRSIRIDVKDAKIFYGDINVMRGDYGAFVGTNAVDDAVDFLLHPEKTPPAILKMVTTIVNALKVQGVETEVEFPTPEMPVIKSKKCPNRELRFGLSTSSSITCFENGKEQGQGITYESGAIKYLQGESHHSY